MKNLKMEKYYIFRAPIPKQALKLDNASNFTPIYVKKNEIVFVEKNRAWPSVTQSVTDGRTADFGPSHTVNSNLTAALSNSANGFKRNKSKKN